MPESSPHRDTVRLLELILMAFLARTRRNAQVAANLAIRWDHDRPRIGVDPDIALIEPAPPEGGQITSLLTWKPGHVPPRFAIEVVSPSNPYKDYETAPVKYGALGTRELVVFDPDLEGPAVRGGPFVLQMWRLETQEDGKRVMTRTYAGDGPARSEELGAWLLRTPENRLRVADDPDGRALWLTAEEQAGQSLRAAVEDLCEAYAVPLDNARRAHLASLDVAGLEALRARIKRERAWAG